ncbi:ferredoxin--NADP reductase [Flavobacteriaceae bacterium]|nr:ferredoxin--NADP reductase [Flavobacteriaceae bacterium]
MKLKVTNIIKETENAVTVCFKNGNFFRKIKYLPGQFIMLDFKVGKDIYKRAYSFSSSPNIDKDLKITVKKVKGGIVSNFINNKLKIGDKIKMDIAMGSFFIQPDQKNKKQYVLFGGGSGITPVFSIAKSLLKNEPDSKVLLIYANQDVGNIIFSNEINALSITESERFKVEHILSDVEGTNYHSGFLTKKLLDKIFKKHNLKYEDHKYMMCGPSGFMDAAKEILKLNGIERKQIMLEAFKAPSIKVAPKNLVSKVTLNIKGKTHELNVPGDKTILQQAMKENISIPYSCRSGMCSTCLGTCSSGEAVMTEGHLLSKDQVAEGKILTCISYPTSEELTIEIE